MALTNVWLETAADGLIRADQVTGIDTHPTPMVGGKPSRWLLDVTVPVPIGSGAGGEWAVTALHRTLVQTPADPSDAPAALARLLAQLDLVSAAGVITTTRERTGSTQAGDAGEDVVVAGSERLRFRFVPFASPAPGHHTGAEYL